MQRRFPSLNALRTFEAAARHLSFSMAAEELNVTQAAVSRQIKLLEDDFGTALFNRLTRAVELTDAGRRLFPQVSDAFYQLELASSQVWGNKGSGVLTVSVLPTFSVKWLMPRLLDFSELHPDIEVHLVNTIAPVNFERAEVDLAIRVGSTESQDSNLSQVEIDLLMVRGGEALIYQELLPDEMIAVASPDYLARHGPITNVYDLQHVDLIHMATRQNAWADYLFALGLKAPPTQDGPSYGHFFLSLQAAIEGRGVALVPEILGKADLRSGLLVQALPQKVQSAGAYYLIGRKSGWKQKKIRIFREWILDKAHRI
ncbi:transcriptional regulator GcvA [Sulfitobacter sp. SH24]|uniref:transcriptional regulator GcvA n=1 Tax=Sulfitobacter sp. SH24 TaxID=3421173 RepID=UPI003F4F879A